jgi:hypothetical protein
MIKLVKNLEIPYLVVAYAMGCVIYFINRNKDYLTVSETAANNKIGRQVFFWGLLISGILYEILMFMWVIPQHHLGEYFRILITILFIFQVLTGIIPARGRRLNNAHLTAAFGLGISMVITVFAFALQSSVHVYTRAICTLLALVMISLIISTHKLSSTKYFRHQNIFFACWHIAMFVVVYFG